MLVGASQGGGGHQAGIGRRLSACTSAGGEFDSGRREARRGSTVTVPIQLYKFFAVTVLADSLDETPCDR